MALLFDRMILHVYDLKTKLCRQLPLALNGHGTLQSGSTGSNGAMVSLRGWPLLLLTLMGAEEVTVW